MTDPALFILAVLTLLGMPGPTNTLLASAGAAEGVRAGLPLIGAALAGYFVAIGVIRLGLAPVLEAWPMLLVTLKAVLVLYLLWVAYRMWRQAPRLVTGDARVRPATLFVATLLNPKALVFALSILPAGATAAAWHFTAFAAIGAATGLGWVLVGRAITLAASGQQHLVQRGASLVLVGFAGLIAASALG